jgi:hypothetical protein
MADPVSIIGAVGSVLTIIDVVSKAIKCINEHRGRWKEADFTFLSLISQLGALRVALVKIQEWMDRQDEEPHHQLVMDLNNAISFCQMLAIKLDAVVGELRETTDAPPLQSARKMKIVLGNRDIEQLQKLIERQTGVLTLLLTACG